MKLGGRNYYTLALALLLPWLAINRAWAGMEVSLEREFERLNQIESQIKRSPAYRRSEELQSRMTTLKLRLSQLANRPDNGPEIDRLRHEIDDLAIQLQQAQKTIAGFREAAGGQSERFFPEVRNRIATFTLDDPHATGLGDPVSFILSKKLLFSTRVFSFAIVNYRQGTDPVSPGELAYFDRVDAITKDQRFRVVLWGHISRDDRGARVDTFLQIPDDADGQAYIQKVRLPEAMGGGSLTARLKSTRILLQSFEANAEAMGALRSAAEKIATLRAAPSETAAVTGHLGEGTERKTHTLVDSRNDWVSLRLSDGSSGWTSVDRYCSGVCSRLLDVANYVNDVVAMPAGLSPRPVPESLAPEANAMLQQLTALRLLATDPYKAVEAAERSVRTTVASRRVTFANILAVSRIKAELTRVTGSNFNQVRLDREMIERLANQLVEASIADPRDIDILENLAVLFAYLGDETRRRLASDIATDLKSKAR